MSRRAWLAVAAVAALEVALFSRYAALDVQLHYWLHLLHGVAAGVTAWVAVAAVRWRPADPTSRRLGLLTAALAGHLFTAIPDVLFLLAGVLHVPWMDVFALHIGIHMVPRALVASWALLGLALLAWLALVARRRVLTAAGVAAVVLAATAAVVVAPPIPSTLAEVRALDDGGLWCPLIAVPGS